jgi:hypothetical protein
VSCDATNFKTDAWTEPLISGNTGIITAVSQASTPPGSPQAGDRHIVGSSPTGAWSGFAENDIAEADGFGNWFNRTPPTDAGWLAYLQDDNRFLSFMASAWSIPGKVSLQVFTASGTWTKPDGISKILVIGTGSGGGGGSPTTANRGGGGGAAGATCIELLDATSLTSETVTIGPAGAAGTSNGNGSAGGNTTFGAHFTANGGNGGNGGTSLTGGVGGTGTGGNVNLQGGDGSAGLQGASSPSGMGGSSFWGGGAGGVSTTSSGRAGRAPGSGGSGGFDAAESGGAGAAGVVFVLEFGF